MKQLSYLIFLLGLIMVAWEYPILYPLKLLVVFFHESSHAIATILTGGTVKELVINQQQGGHVISQGGNRFITLSAGYIGSLLWGVVIYLASVKSHYDKAIMTVLAFSIIIITVVLSSSLFSWLFGLLIGGAMLLMAKYLAEQYNDFALRLIGLTSMMYAPLDIYSDTISRSYLQSDAYLLADYVGGTTLLWGSIWIIISVAVIFYCLKCSLNQINN
ncbi:MAG: M50 family metallopeptidase [Methylococcales bacterium]